MGLWAFIFAQESWKNLYGKCAERTIDEWNRDGTSNVTLGVIYAILGIVCEVQKF